MNGKGGPKAALTLTDRLASEHSETSTGRYVDLDDVGGLQRAVDELRHRRDVAAACVAADPELHANLSARVAELKERDPDLAASIAAEMEALHPAIVLASRWRVLLWQGQRRPAAVRWHRTAEERVETFITGHAPHIFTPAERIAATLRYCETFGIDGTVARPVIVRVLRGEVSRDA